MKQKVFEHQKRNLEIWKFFNFDIIVKIKKYDKKR